MTVKIETLDKKNHNYRLKIAGCRLGAFPSLFVPSKMEGSAGNPRYTAAFHIAADDAGLEELKTLISELSRSEVRKPADIEGGSNCPLSNGNNNINRDGQIYRGSENTFILKAARQEKQNAPAVVKKIKGAVLPATENEVYAGCYVNAIVDIYVLKANPGKQIAGRVCATIVSVMFAKDGERFGGGGSVAADSDFDDFEDSELEDFSETEDAPW